MKIAELIAAEASDEAGRRRAERRKVWGLYAEMLRVGRDASDKLKPYEATAPQVSRIIRLQGLLIKIREQVLDLVARDAWQVSDSVGCMNELAFVAGEWCRAMNGDNDTTLEDLGSAVLYVPAFSAIVGKAFGFLQIQAAADPAGFAPDSANVSDLFDDTDRDRLAGMGYKLADVAELVMFMAIAWNSLDLGEFPKPAEPNNAEAPQEAAAETEAPSVAAGA